MNFKAKPLKKSLIILVLLLVGATAFAASGDTLTIGGSVPLVLDLVVTTDGSEIILDLNTADGPAADVQIATIAIDSNAMAGWDLIISSANGGEMLNADGDAITYTLNYIPTIASPLNADTAPTVAGLSYAENTATTGDAGTLVMDYTESTDYAAGYYSDQLTLVLRAK